MNENVSFEERITLEALEKNFNTIIETFRDLSQTHDCGYAKDRAGWGYFDLSVFDEGIAPEVCLYFEELNFRIRENPNRLRGKYSLLIEGYESDESEIFSDNVSELEELITEYVNGNKKLTQKIKNKVISYHTEDVLKPIEFNDNMTNAYIDWALRDIIENKQYIIDETKDQHNIIYKLNLENSDVLQMKQLSGSDVALELITKQGIKVSNTSWNNGKALKDVKALLEQYIIGA